MLALKRHAQTILRRVGLYQRVKASRVYDLYWILRIGQSSTADAERAIFTGSFWRVSGKGALSLMSE